MHASSLLKQDEVVFIIDFGDGTTTEIPAEVNILAITASIDLNHQYDADGVYEISVIVKDSNKDEELAAFSNSITVVVSLSVLSHYFILSSHTI